MHFSCNSAVLYINLSNSYLPKPRIRITVLITIAALSIPTVSQSGREDDVIGYDLIGWPLELTAAMVIGTVSLIQA